MELHYVEVKDWDKLNNHDIILFKLPKEQIRYQVILTSYGIFCENTTTLNTAIFDYLELNAADFVQDIVGYLCTGGWPEVKSIDDLKKVIKALDDECVKKFGNPNTSKFKIGDKVRILPKDSNIQYSPVYTEHMEKYAGRIYTIQEICKNTGSVVLEQLDYYWDSKALELVDEKEEYKIMDINQAKDGDYISITNIKGIKYIVLFRGLKDNLVIRYASYNLSNYQFNFNPEKSYGTWGTLIGISKVNYATEEEKQLLDSKLLEEGYRWNDLTKQLENIGVINTETIHTGYIVATDFQSEEITNPLNYKKRETQFEAELNLFPTKKHYQLNFNY